MACELDQQDNGCDEVCTDARRLCSGSYSAWLQKVKSDGAWLKKVSSTTKRYFTIDFEMQMFYYTHKEGDKKISSPVPFNELAGAERMPPLPRTKKGAKAQSGFIVKTHTRNFELLTPTAFDAAQWVSALNAAKELVQGSAEAKLASPGETQSQEASAEAPREVTEQKHLPALAPLKPPHVRREAPAPIAAAQPESLVASPESPEAAADLPGVSGSAALGLPAPEVGDPFESLDELEKLASSALPVQAPAVKVKAPDAYPAVVAATEACAVAAEATPPNVEPIREQATQSAARLPTPAAEKAPTKARPMQVAVHAELAALAPEQAVAPSATEDSVTQNLGVQLAAGTESAPNVEKAKPQISQDDACADIGEPQPLNSNPSKAKPSEANDETALDTAQAFVKAPVSPSTPAVADISAAKPGDVDTAPDSEKDCLADAPKVDPSKLPQSHNATPDHADNAVGKPISSETDTQGGSDKKAKGTLSAQLASEKQSAATQLEEKAAEDKPPKKKREKGSSSVDAIKKAKEEARRSKRAAKNDVEFVLVEKSSSALATPEDATPVGEAQVAAPAGAAGAVSAASDASSAAPPVLDAGGVSDVSPKVLPPVMGRVSALPPLKPLVAAGKLPSVAAPAGGDAAIVSATAEVDKGTPSDAAEEAAAEPTASSEDEVAQSAARQKEASGWDSDEEKTCDRKEAGAAVKDARKCGGLEASGWDSEGEEGAGGKEVKGKPSIDGSGNEASGWDSEGEEDEHKKTVARLSPSAKTVPEAASASMEPSGWDWDEEDESEAKQSKPEVDSCGAQKNSACGAFVTAKGPIVDAAATTGTPVGELDDLLGMALASGASSAGKGSSSNGFVPNFHCTGCDFQVLRVENYVWASGASYMHFRNNYPNVMKLRAKLEPKKGCCGYCCQCSWKSAEGVASLEDVADGLKWRQIAT